MSKKVDYSISFGIGTLVGVLTGVLLGVLFSPKSGQEMRNELKTATKKIIRHGQELNIVRAKKISSNAIARIQYTIESQFNKVLEAIKADRMAAAKRKEELESIYKY